MYICIVNKSPFRSRFRMKIDFAFPSIEKIIKFYKKLSASNTSEKHKFYQAIKSSTIALN